LLEEGVEVVDMRVNLGRWGWFPVIGSVEFERGGLIADAGEEDEDEDEEDAYAYA
jgi:predicted sugar kinase